MLNQLHRPVVDLGNMKHGFDNRISSGHYQETSGYGALSIETFYQFRIGEPRPQQASMCGGCLVNVFFEEKKNITKAKLIIITAKIIIPFMME